MHSTFIMKSLLKTIQYGWTSRRAWWFTASSRTQARFARTIFGGFWLGLTNLLSIAALALVYGTVFKVSDFSSYVVFLGTGLVIWNTLSAAVSLAPSLFEHNKPQLQNTNINPVFYTLEEWAFQVQTFLQSYFLVLLGLAFFKRIILLRAITIGLLPMANFLVAIYWIPLLVCLIGARYRDTYQLVPIILQLGFLLSPILYQKKNLGSLTWTADFNPIYRLISPLRSSLIDGTLLWNQTLLMVFVNILGLTFSIALLNRERKYLPFLV